MAELDRIWSVERTIVLWPSAPFGRAKKVRYFRWKWLAWLYVIFWLPPFGPFPVYCSTPRRHEL